MPSLEELLHILRSHGDPRSWNINMIVTNWNSPGKMHKRANDLDPKNPWTNYATYYIDPYLPPEVQITGLDKAISYDPDEAWFYHDRGYLKARMKDDTGNFDDLNKAIELQPRFAHAYSQLGYYYVGQQKYGEALVASQKALEINPNIGNFWYRFARTQYYFLNPMTSTGLEECIKSIDRAIAMDPEATLYHSERWWYLLRAERRVEAREEAKIFKSLAITDDEKQYAQQIEVQTDWQNFNRNLKNY